MNRAVSAALELLHDANAERRARERETCGDCCNHTSVATVEYGGELVGACPSCLPGLLELGATLIDFDHAMLPVKVAQGLRAAREISS